MMLDTFITSFKLKNAYKVNGIIYSLKSIPLIKKLLPTSLYASTGLKKFANAVSLLYEINTFFFGKALYLLLMVFLPGMQMPGTKSACFIHVFFFLTISGGFLNTQIFHPTKDKYYALILLRMNAKKYMLSNYIYYLSKILIGFLPFTLLFGLLSGVNVFLCLLMPVYVAAVKLIISAVALLDFKKSGRIKNDSIPSPTVWIYTAVSFTAAYAAPALGYVMNGIVFSVLALTAAAAAVYALIYIIKFDEFRSLCKKLLSATIFFMNRDRTAAAQNIYLKKIDAAAKETSGKSGYKYFNELFMKRHSRLLTNSAKRITLVAVAALAAVTAMCFIIPEMKAKVNRMMLTFLPYFLFIMYCINRGKVITQAMFMTCDHSMLTYRFYRQPKAILALFTERLKYIVLINLMPSAAIAFGLPLLLLVTGGTTEPINYALLFVSIIGMSVLFSVHHMVLYYLLQPYNVNVEMKSAAFMIANMLTYFLSYIAIGKKIPTFIFGTAITAFCIIYTIAALIIVYKLAPVTFRLRP